MARQDRRTKAQDVWGHPKEDHPDASLAYQTVTETRTVNQKFVLPPYGTEHPTIPGIYVTIQGTSPGDDTDCNLTQFYETLPGVWKYTKVISEDGVVVSIGRRKNLIANITPTETVTVVGGDTIFTKVTQENANALIADEVSTARVLNEPERDGSRTSQFGPVETAVTVVETSAFTADNGTDVVDSSVTPGDGLSGTKQTSRYASLPGPWLYGYTTDAETNIGVRMRKRIIANGSIEGGISAPPSATISVVATSAGPTDITLASPLVLKTGEIITISGENDCTPHINGNWVVTVIDSTHIQIPTAVSVVSGSALGSVRLQANWWVDVQDVNDRQSIEINSQVDTSTLTLAIKIYPGSVQYPWKEVLVAIDLFNDVATATTSASGTFEIPTNITFHYAYEFKGVVAVRTARYTGKTDSSTTRTFSYGPPTVSGVIKVRTSSGEVISTGWSLDTHVAVSVQSAGSNTQTSLSNSLNYSITRIEDILTNGFSSGNLSAGGSGFAKITLKLSPSDPTTFTAGASILVDATVTPGRLGLYSKDELSVVVPTPFPQ